MSDDASSTRFVVIVPAYGSAYYLEGGAALVQAPIHADGYVRIPAAEIPERGADIGPVDWDLAFETLAEAEPLRQVERTLRALPTDATVTATDPVLISRADLAALLAAIGSARVRAADAYFAESRNFSRAGETAAADEQQHAGILMGRSGEQLLEAAGAIPVSSNPIADLSGLMSKVRWRDSDSRQP